VKKLTIRDFLQQRQESLALELLTGDDAGMDRVIEEPNLSSPGLVLAGYTERLPHGRIQVLGETEITYLQTLAPDRLRTTLDAFFSLDIPAVIVSKRLPVSAGMVEAARDRQVPLLRSTLKTGELYRRTQSYLEEHFAPSTILHGSLADVYGVGLLFIGRSGIGKSECVLDLVERGHRLVADDVVHITRRGNDILIGRGHELQR